MSPRSRPHNPAVAVRPSTPSRRGGKVQGGLACLGKECGRRVLVTYKGFFCSHIFWIFLSFFLHSSLGVTRIACRLSTCARGEAQ